jgi:hypothetical protein
MLYIHAQIFTMIFALVSDNILNIGDNYYDTFIRSIEIINCCWYFYNFIMNVKHLRELNITSQSSYEEFKEKILKVT